MKELKWNTYVTWVDEDTGEILTKENAKENYTIKESKTETKVYETTATRRIVHICRKKGYRQLGIWG